MKSIRLNESIRHKIISALLEKRFSKEDEAKAKKSQSLAQQVYNDQIQKKDRDIMATLPDGWLPMVSSLRVQFGDDYTYLSLKESVPLPHNRSKYTFAVYEKDHKLTKKFSDIDSKDDEIRDGKVDIKKKAWAILTSVRTTKQLFDVWPEVQGVVLSVIETPEEPKHLPALPISEVNKAIGLP